MDELINQIKNIDTTYDLQKINRAVNNQWVLINRNRKKEFNIGDMVRLIDRDMKGIIKKINPKTIDVEVETMHGLQIFRCYPSLINKVNNDE
jgi:hypothetical protein